MYRRAGRNSNTLSHLCALLVTGLLLSACASPLKPTPQPVSHALSAPSQTEAWQPLLDNLPSDQPASWFDAQDVGADALFWRLATVDSATTSIDAQYFIWKMDAVGSLLLERVLQAADRGVRVRLLLDDSFLSGEDMDLLAAAAHPNLEMRVFNPFQVRSSHMLSRFLENLNDFERTNHRMHNKILVADNTVAVIGGRNIADEYFGFSKEVNFRTFDVLTTGMVVPEISNSFDDYWNSEWAFPIESIDHKQGTRKDLLQLRKKLHANHSVLESWIRDNGIEDRNWQQHWSGLAPALLPGRAVVIQDDPHFEGTTPPVEAATRIRKIFEKTDKQAMSVSAYLVPSASLLEIANHLTDRGVRIRVLTNSLASNNHIPAHTAYRHQRRKILAAGVELHELMPNPAERTHVEAPGFRGKHIGLHAKILVLDERLVFVGTINVDPRSMTLNTEVSLMIESPALARAIQTEFEPDFSPENSWHVTADDTGKLTWTSENEVLEFQPAGSIWRRLADTVIGLFPVDSQM